MHTSSNDSGPNGSPPRKGALLGASTLTLVPAAAALAFFAPAAPALAWLGAVAGTVALGFGLWFAARHRVALARLEGERNHLKTAVDNMSDGLLLFDASGRVVVCNQGYLDMFGLAPGAVTLGMHLRDLLEWRKSNGGFIKDVDDFCAKLLKELGQGKTTERLQETPSGRLIRARNRPLAGGGWVAIFEDVTDKRLMEEARAEAQARLEEQSMRLDAALNNIAHGLCVHDAEGRVVLFNERYAEMIRVPAERLCGRSLRDVFQEWKDTGVYSGDPDRDFATLVASLKEGRCSKTVRTHDKRILRVIDTPLPDGGWVATLEDITAHRRAEEERDRDRAFLNQIVDNVPVMIAVKSMPERRFVLVNRAAEKLWGIARADAIGKTARELFLPEQADLVDRHDLDALASDAPLELDAHPNMARSGEIRTVTSKRMALRNRHGVPEFLVSVVEDVSEQKRAEAERDRNRQFLDQIVDSVPTGIIVKDAETGRYLLVNRIAGEYCGQPREKIIGRTAAEIWTPETAALIQEQDRQLLESESGFLVFEEHLLQTPSRGALWVNSKRLLIRGADGKPDYMLAVIDDVTDRRQSHERIAYLAHHDSLTDLPNRVMFREKLEQCLRQLGEDEQVALLYFDLDHFKTINDTFGHSVGDEFLKAVAARLRACVKAHDVVGRLGGDEFAIIQTGISGPDDVTALVARLFEVIREPQQVLGHQLVADASIGIALAPRDGTDPDVLLKNADLAMYGAKGDRRGTYRFFEPAMDARIKARLRLEMDLREAIAAGDLQLHYQPIIRPQDFRGSDFRISGCEALIRWPHPARGMIPPADFIPVAEETGIIVRLGEWILQTACAAAAVWPDDMKLAVNVSPVQFTTGSFVETVVRALASSGLPAHRLELEITEAVLIRDEEAALSTLHRLRALGVRIAMDDFGTGYSSLGYLQRYPFDKIKIDQSFVKDVPASEDSLSIVQALLHIAGTRGITTTAEGVETEEQAAALQAMGCTELQGFLFSPPVPAHELEWLLRRERVSDVA